MSDPFPAAFSKLLEIEKGFVNDPLDRGGPTKYGITMQTLSEYMGPGKMASIDDVKGLTLNDAERIYRVLFWEPAQCDQIRDDRVAYALFDQAVNRGVGTAVKLMQSALNENLANADLAEDGVIGPKTIALINAQEPNMIGMWFCEACQIRYAKICELNQTQLRFLRGWLARSHKLQRLFWDQK